MMNFAKVNSKNFKKLQKLLEEQCFQDLVFWIFWSEKKIRDKQKSPAYLADTYGFYVYLKRRNSSAKFGEIFL
jgi:hypothetical protein